MLEIMPLNSTSPQDRTKFYVYVKQQALDAMWVCYKQIGGQEVHSSRWPVLCLVTEPNPYNAPIFKPSAQNQVDYDKTTSTIHQL